MLHAAEVLVVFHRQIRVKHRRHFQHHRPRAAHHHIHPLAHAGILFEKARVNQVKAAGVADFFIHNQNLAVVAQIGAGKERAPQAHRQCGMHFHAGAAQFGHPIAVEKVFTAHRIGQNHAVYTALRGRNHRIQQGFDFPLRLDNVKRQQAGLLRLIDVGQYRIHNAVGAVEQGHGIAVGGRQPRALRRHAADAVIAVCHLAAHLQLAVGQIAFGKIAVKTVHFHRALGARRAQARLADQ